MASQILGDEYDTSLGCFVSRTEHSLVNATKGLFQTSCCHRFVCEHEMTTPGGNGVQVLVGITCPLSVKELPAEPKSCSYNPLRSTTNQPNYENVASIENFGIDMSKFFGFKLEHLKKLDEVKNKSTAKHPWQISKEILEILYNRDEYEQLICQCCTSYEENVHYQMKCCKKLTCRTCYEKTPGKCIWCRRNVTSMVVINGMCDIIDGIRKRAVQRFVDEFDALQNDQSNYSGLEDQDSLDFTFYSWDLNEYIEKMKSDEIVAEKVELKQEIQSLKTHTRKLEKERSEYKESIEIHEAEYGELESEYRSLELEYKDMKEDYREQLDIERRQCKTAEAKIKTLENDLSIERDKFNEATNRYNRLCNTLKLKFNGSANEPSASEDVYDLIRTKEAELNWLKSERERLKLQKGMVCSMKLDGVIQNLKLELSKQKHQFVFDSKSLENQIKELEAIHLDQVVQGTKSTSRPFFHKRSGRNDLQLQSKRTKFETEERDKHTHRFMANQTDDEIVIIE